MARYFSNYWICLDRVFWGKNPVIQQLKALQRSCHASKLKVQQRDVRLLVFFVP